LALLLRLSLLLHSCLCLRILLRFLVSHVSADDTAARCPKYRMTAANKMAAHTPDCGAFKATGSIGLTDREAY
jgi:hypothetical protein